MMRQYDLSPSVVYYTLYLTSLWEEILKENRDRDHLFINKNSCCLCFFLLIHKDKDVKKGQNVEFDISFWKSYIGCWVKTFLLKTSGTKLFWRINYGKEYYIASFSFERILGG